MFWIEKVGAERNDRFLSEIDKFGWAIFGSWSTARVFFTQAKAEQAARGCEGLSIKIMESTFEGDRQVNA